MSRISLITAIAAFLPVVAVAQTKPQRLEFEVASIRPSPPIDASVKIGMHTDGSQVRFDYLSLRDCMRIAYGVKDYQIVGPDWVSSDRFNITAKLPEGSYNEDQRREMLKNLLLDRFKLATHNDKKEFAVYALIQGKNGVRLKETVPDPATDNAPSKGLNINASGSAAGVFVDLGQGSFYNFADNKLTGRKMPMPRISDALAVYMDKPVIDLTGLPDTKNYDFTFEITADDYRTMLIRSAIRAGVSLPPQALALADNPTESLNTALDLSGLKLDSRKAPLDVIVVDKADKNPTDN